MAQQPYTVLQLIKDAYFGAGIVAPDYQDLTPDQISQGFSSLNSVIAQPSIEGADIPYYKTYDFVATIGEQEYFIEDLISIGTLSFFLGEGVSNLVRYPVASVSRDSYIGTARPQNTQGLPLYYFLERELGGARLYMFLTPQQAYPFQLHGLFRLQAVELTQNLALTLDRFFIDYLMLRLSQRLCAIFNIKFPLEMRNLLKDYQIGIKSRLQAPDLSMRINSAFRNQPTINYAQMEIGKGYMPIGNWR